MRDLNAAGLDLIKGFEGLRLTAYDDNGAAPGGVWTIGYGHTGGVQPGDRITEAEAERLLRGDLGEAIEAVERLVTVPLSDNQFAALVSFTFNLGEGNLSKSTLLRRLNAGRYEDVPSQLMRWVFQGKTRLKGLERRRAAEGELWLRDDTAAPNYVPAEEGQGKRALASRTVWGGALAIVAPSLSELASRLEGYAGLPPQIFWILAALTIVGGGLAIWGRIRVMREEGA